MGAKLGKLLVELVNESGDVWLNSHEDQFGGIVPVLRCLHQGPLISYHDIKMILRKTGVLTEEAETELALTVVEVDCIDISGYILFIGILAHNLNKI